MTEPIEPKTPEAKLNPDEPGTKAADDPGEDDKLTPKQQAALDARIKRELAKAKEQAAIELQAEKERLAKEAREAALLEKENYKELYEAAKTEAEDMRKKSENAELNAKTDTLLDNADIITPRLRNLIKALPADLEIRAQRIAELKEDIEAEAETRVAKRLHTPAPDKAGTVQTKKIAEMTIAEKTKLRDTIGNDAFVKRIQTETTAS
jgi:hypothetical protein